MFAISGILGATIKPKKINIIMNSHPNNCFTILIKEKISYALLQDLVQQNWGFYKVMRIFNAEGIEYFEEDLNFLLENQNLYITKGEQFDANSSFGQYQIIKILGEGGFGKVSLGKHKISQELVAIKVMKAQKIQFASEIDFIFREVQNLKALTHTNIVKLYKCYALKDMKLVLIMQYMQGGQLLALLKQKIRFTSDLALIFFRQIVSAVMYCHSKNIVHRDLKLENILIEKKGSLLIKIADFGISGISDKFNPDVNSGTLKYMPPQVLSGLEKGNSPTIDVWALGCILYYMLYGKLPFVGKTVNQTIHLIIQGHCRYSKEIYVPESLLNLLKRMLDSNSKTRIKSFEIMDQLQLLENLSKFHEHEHEEAKQKQTYRTINSKIKINMMKEKKIEHKKNFEHLRNIIKIPKKLQQQKIAIENELKEYQQNRKYSNRLEIHHSLDNRNRIDLNLHKQNFSLQKKISFCTKRQKLILPPAHCKSINLPPYIKKK